MEGSNNTLVQNQEEVKELQSLPSIESNLSKHIEQMESSLAQSGNPDFKTFWDSRKECLDLLKENLSPVMKALYWSKYRDLTKEAKRLKDILEEQSAFAVEQIEIAIKAIENEINEMGLKIEKIPYTPLPKSLKALKNNLNLYDEKQKELNFFNTQAAHVNALRKELIKTDMRIRQKNKFFQRLSAIGDLVFPRRKALIAEISDLFTADVKGFIKANLSGVSTEKSLQPLRDEIKNLQAVAKTMTLNTQSFSETRLKLSECWDKIRAVEKERKKEQAEEYLIYQKNAGDVREKIQEFLAIINEKKLLPNEAQNKFEEINQFMRSKQLGREDIQVLKSELAQVYIPLKNKLIDEEKKRKEIELEKEEFRQTEIKALEERCHSLEEKLKDLEKRELSEAIASINQDMKALALSEMEQTRFSRLLAFAYDALEEFAASEVLVLPDNDPQKIPLLENILKKETIRRNSIKEQMEKYRKACGGSGLDFEQSLYYNDLFNKEKNRLEKLAYNLTKLEMAIAKLKG